MNLEKLEEQIRVQMKKAYFDLVTESLEKKENLDWVVTLYEEIKNRLLKVVKPNSKTYNDINESLDSQIFKQLLENDLFDGEYMVNLVNTIFGFIEKLQAPARDEICRESKNKIFSSGQDVIAIIPTFISEVHFLIDFIELDLKNFYENIKK